MPTVLLNKPFRVLCQFRDSEGRPSLADLVDVPGVYPAGRLDFDSEGLLLLTDDGRLQARLSQPRSKIFKTYWAQVEGDASDDQLQQLRAGVKLKDGMAKAVSARRVAEPANLWPRDPPVRYRASVPDCWIELTIAEGRNRQVRRMTAAVGLPTLRLIRYSIGPFTLDGLVPGEAKTISNEVAWSKL
jgi:23S rRNA pseudouridine2457 synthase